MTVGFGVSSALIAGAEHKKHLESLHQIDYVRSVHDYSIPDVELTDMQGETISFRQLLNQPEPLLMQFIFTTCTTICPVLSASFAAAQDELQAAGPEFRMVSISIDPEYDTPKVLRNYAERFNAGSGWNFLTGPRETIASVQKAFGAWYPGNNKMYHRPYTYLRASPEMPWVRLDGILSTAELVAEYQSLFTIEAGALLYLEGVTVSGKAASATLAGDISISSEQLSCAGCHRRSGYGSSEGGIYVLPVTGPALFAPRDLDRADLFKKLFKEEQPKTFSARIRSPQMRPAYSEESLARVIREGVDPAGNTLNELMPRYQLGDDDMANLIAYLKILSHHQDPGVDNQRIHFATVVSQGVDARKREAMLMTLRTFVEWMNLDTEGDLNNPQFSPNYRSDFIKAYRTWSLHVWELSGESGTWRDQLVEYYEEQPVFALVSGLVDGPWAPIAEFSEQRQLPALFPNTDLPQLNSAGYYSVYFTRGLELEAELIDQHLRSEAGLPKQVSVFNIYHRQSSGTIPGKHLQALLEDHQQFEVIDREFSSVADLLAVLDYVSKAKGSQDVLVIWPGPLAGKVISALTKKFTALGQTFLPASTLEALPEELPTQLVKSLRFSYPYELPGAHHPRAFRIRAWMNTRKLDIIDQRLQFNTYYAMTVLQFGLDHIVDNFSRDFLLEYVEHEAENALNPGTYPYLSLGPGQRFASRGGYLVKLQSSPEQGWQVAAVSEWIVP